MALFALIASGDDNRNLLVSLRALLAHTAPASRHGVVVVDNGGRCERPAGIPPEACEFVTQSPARTFEPTVNPLIERARSMGTDLVVLSASVVVTPGWFESLVGPRPALAAPVSNVELPQEIGGVVFAPSMSIDQFAGRERHLAALVERHRTKVTGFQAVPLPSAACVRIPAEIIHAIGGFDPGLAGGGGWPDYALRAWLAGFPSHQALGSYVLRLDAATRHGSTLDAAHPAPHVRGFAAKWGDALTYAFLGDDWNLFLGDETLRTLIRRRQFKAAIEALCARPSLTPFVKHQRRASIGAVCCLYDDDAWVEAMTASIYDACDEVLFLVGNRPWNGEPTDQEPLIAKLRSLPDPAGKIRIERGDWATEALQRNAGLRMLADRGIDYCLVVDADEIHDPRVLARAVGLARQTPQIDCWRMHFYTYWKSSRYRVEPPEPVPMPFLIRVGTCQFVENRAVGRAREAVVPLEVGRLHHMSYARTDAQIRRKIETFSHAGQMKPDWYERVWLGWDRDNSLENLNPCWPAAYRRVVEQPRELLPALLRPYWDQADWPGDAKG